MNNHISEGSPSTDIRTHKRFKVHNEPEIMSDVLEPNLYLPPELWVQIFSRLQWRLLVKCNQICSTFHKIIKSAVLLQYIIELGANGLDDSSNPAFSELPVSLKLALLLQYKQNWRRLEWREREWVTVPGKCAAYELVGDWFAKCKGMPIFQDFDGAEVEIVGGSREFVFCKLPRPNVFLGTDISRLNTYDGMDRREMKAILHQDVGIPCRDFNFDPIQDLLVLVEEPSWFPISTLKLHLRSLSMNGRYHPSAFQPVLTYSTKDPFESIVIQILDDIVAIMFRVGGLPRILIWDWVRGDLLVDMYKFKDQVIVDDFTLLSPYAFMTTLLYPSSINLYAFRSPEPRKYATSSRSFSPSPSSRAHSPVVQLYLPACHSASKFQYEEIMTHTAPFTKHPAEDKIFSMHEEARMHILSMTVSNHKFGRVEIIEHGADDWDVENMLQVNDHGEVLGGADVVDAVGPQPNGLDNAVGNIPADPNLLPRRPPTGSSTSHYILVVFNRTFLAYLDDALESDAVEAPQDEEDDSRQVDISLERIRQMYMKPRSPKVIPWEQWGPKNTRIWPERLGKTWLRYTHGPRFIQAIHTRWPSERCKLLIRDFAVHPGRAGDDDSSTEARDAAEPDSKCLHSYVSWGTRIGRFVSLSGEMKVEKVMIEDSTRVNSEQGIDDVSMEAGDPSSGQVEESSNKQVFERDIVTYLPYREVISKEDFGFSGFMIDEERVIGMSTLAFADDDMRGLEVFTF